MSNSGFEPQFPHFKLVDPLSLSQAQSSTELSPPNTISVTIQFMPSFMLTPLRGPLQSHSSQSSGRASVKVATTMVFQAPAKVNLYLELLARLSSGYHSLDTVMATVSWYDSLSFATPLSSPESIELCVVDQSLPRMVPGSIPTDESNLVVKALLRLRQAAGISQGARVTLIKRIPSQAGLGGGSSDAATALLGANQFWGLNWSLEQLQPLAAELGSDVAFFLYGGLARCRSRGEVVEPLGVHCDLTMVIVKPPVGLSTAEVYRRCSVAAQPGSADEICRALQDNRIREVGACLFNRLAAPAEQMTDWMERLGRRFERTGSLGWQLSGSGSACFGIYPHSLLARRAARVLKQETQLGVQVVRTVRGNFAAGRG